jgi:hypothetical protein
MSVKDEALLIAHKYIGKHPSDFGVTSWHDVKEKMVKEIVELFDKEFDKEKVKQNNHTPNIQIDFVAPMGMGKTAVHEILLHSIKNNKGLIFNAEQDWKGKIASLDDIHTSVPSMDRTITPIPIIKYKKLKGEDVEEKGIRGVTNNRKLKKKRKKAKNGRTKRKK